MPGADFRAFLFEAFEVYLCANDKEPGLLMLTAEELILVSIISSKIENLLSILCLSAMLLSSAPPYSCITCSRSSFILIILRQELLDREEDLL